MSHHQDDWCALLPLAEFACNNTVNASTKLTPFFALTASHPRFELLSPPESIVPAAEDRVKELQSIHAELKESLEKAAADSKKFADVHRSEEPDMEVGQMVWLDARNVRSDRPCRKLDWKRLGPFRISRKINRAAYELDLPPHLNIHRVFHVSLLEPVKENEYSSRNQSKLPPPILIEGQEEYLVNKILDSKLVRGRLRYLIDWQDYPPSERCWVPAVDVHAPEKVRRFHLENPNKPAPSEQQPR